MAEGRISGLSEMTNNEYTSEKEKTKIRTRIIVIYQNV